MGQKHSSSPEPRSESKSRSNSKSKSNCKPKLNCNPKSNSKPKSNSDSRSKSKSENKSKTKSKSKQKIILILTFEDNYMNKLNNCISHVPISEDEIQTVFQESITYSGFDLKLLLLNHMCLNQWNQYYNNAHGIILVYSSTNGLENSKLIEVNKALNNENLRSIPLLVVFDSSFNNKISVEKLNEFVKEQSRERSYKILNVDFDKNILNMKNGIDWIVGYI